MIWVWGATAYALMAAGMFVLVAVLDADQPGERLTTRELLLVASLWWLFAILAVVDLWREPE